MEMISIEFACNVRSRALVRSQLRERAREGCVDEDADTAHMSSDGRRRASDASRHVPQALRGAVSAGDQGILPTRERGVLGAEWSAGVLAQGQCALGGGDHAQLALPQHRVARQGEGHARQDADRRAPSDTAGEC